MNFVQQLLTRLQTESPALYKKIQNIAWVVGGICGLLITVLQMGFITASWTGTVQTVCGGIIAFFIGVGLTAATTTTDSRLIDQKTVDNVLKYKCDDTTSKN